MAVTVAAATAAAGAEVAAVDCPGEARAVGGGSAAGNNNLRRSVPLRAGSTSDLAGDGDVPTGWLVEYSAVANNEAVSVYAICVP